MKVGIIGAGFTGLAAAYELQKKGHEVTIFEKDPFPGGLAIGYKEKGWEWTLEKHYHHWFTNDEFILNLAREIDYPVIIKRPKTSIFLEGKSYQLDSPLAILKFPKLNLIEKIRMGIVLAFLRFNPIWKPLERLPAIKTLSFLMGKKTFKMIWEPQLRNKMGKYADEISLVWFWTRIYKRTPSLAYPQGGFLNFAQNLVSFLEKKKGKILFNTETVSISENNDVLLTCKTIDGKITNYEFDKVIVTLPSFLFLKIANNLPEKYINKLQKLRGLGASNMIIRLKKPFMTDDTYWLSICEANSPVMVVVEHTNLINKKYFNNENIIYVGNYPDSQSKEFTLKKEELINLYDPILKKINPNYRSNIISFEVFRAPFAQPIVPTNYSRYIPPMKTPLKNVILANIEQVYPWDRGTNYAVELGQKAANLIDNSATQY